MSSFLRVRTTSAVVDLRKKRGNFKRRGGGLKPVLSSAGEMNRVHIQRTVFTLGSLICLLLMLSPLFITGGSYRTSEGHIYGKDWGYEYELAPNAWPRKFEACSGRRQSPINIDMSSVVVNSSLGRILLQGFKEKRVFNVKNIGSTVLLTPVSQSPPIGLEGEKEHEKYRLHSVHFHWTSEHAINKQYYSMESHMVMFNEKYPNVTAALDYPDGIEVLSTMFALSPYTNNARLAVLTDAVAHVLEPDFSINVTMALEDILPNYISAYFRYFGSLTVPPCDEIVTWTMFYPPNYIGPRQMKLFRYLHRLSHDNKIDSWRKLNNRRPLQPLNGRAVQMYTTNYQPLHAG